MNTRHHPTTVFDADDEVPNYKVGPADPGADAIVKRPRGRPKGSLGKTTNTNPLLSCDFYFFRACLEKIDVGDAADRYLAHRGSMDRRTAVVYERDLRGRIQRAINFIDERDKAQAQFNSILAKEVPVFFGPTLAEFATRFEEDMFSENELLELYEEEYGCSQPLAGENTLKQKRDALNWLFMRLATFPKSDQPVGLWIDQSIEKQVRQFGVITLGNLIDWINLTGRRWFDKLEGVGKHRAQRILIFLLQNEKHFERGLSNRLRFALESKYVLDEPAYEDALVIYGTGQNDVVSVPVRRDDSHATDVQMFGIVPFESLNWPPELLGQDGVFRSHTPNTFAVNNDREAIEAWFKTLAEKSTSTQESYRRSVERLVLWSVVERRCSLSSLTTLDFTAFRDFLRDPPPHWCSRFPAMRYSQEWRPMRGPMGDASVQATMSAVATLFADLTTCGYLSANAVASVRTAKRQAMQMDVMRSFAEEDLQAIKRTVAEMKSGMSKTRLLATLLLFQTSGMRRSEVANLKWGQIAPVRLNNRISDSWAATFTGKGNKERIVPLQDETIEALKAHLADRLALVDEKVLPKEYAAIKLEDTPVLSILEYGLTKRKAGKGDTPADSLREGNKNGALSASRIYMVLKRFFKEVAKTVESEGGQAGQAKFEKASTHWLRHTFAHQALAASDRDIAAVQQILGHTDIGTTGLYVKADMTSRVAAVKGVVGFNRMS